MFPQNYSTFCVLWTGILTLGLVPEPPYLPLLVIQAPAALGGARILPDPQPMTKVNPELPKELSDLQSEPLPGLYTSAPWSMIIRVLGAVAVPMPTTIPPKARFHERSIEPRILLIPRDEPRFQ